MRRNRVPTLTSLLIAIGLVALASPALASHNRGVDAWASVDNVTGVVTIEVTTRWREGTESEFDACGGSGVNACRFGGTVFICPIVPGSTFVAPRMTGMILVKVGDTSAPAPACTSVDPGETTPGCKYKWPMGAVGTNDPQTVPAFDLAATTISEDAAGAFFDARTQRLKIPMGPAAITPPADQFWTVPATLNLPAGDYELIWNDWSRIVGIQNIDPGDTCGDLDDSGFGFRVQFRWNPAIAGTRKGPILSSGVNPVVVRGQPWVTNLGASSPDNSPLGYALVPVMTVPGFPDFGAATQVPGITLTQLGQLSIPAAITGLPATWDGTSCVGGGLCDNAFDPGTQGDYLVRVRISDSKGFKSERDILVDAVNSPNQAPVLGGVSNPTLAPGYPTAFAMTITATDPSGDGPLTLRALNPPPGATFATVSGGSPLSQTFTWQPGSGDIGTHQVTFEVTDNGTSTFAGPGGSNYDKITTNAVSTIIVGSPPHFDDVANQTVGASSPDPTVCVQLAESKTFAARASDPNTSDVLTYTAPFLNGNDLTNPANNTLNVSMVDTTDFAGNRIGRVTVSPPNDPSLVGTHVLTLVVNDGTGLSDTQLVVITVGCVNQSPIFSVLPPSQVFAVEGQPVSFPMTASDPDSPTVTLCLVDGPNPCDDTGPLAGQLLSDALAGNPGNPASVTFSWTPTPEQAGATWPIVFRATDGAINEDASTLIFVAAATATAPNVALVSPNHGPPAGGTTVTLSGQGLGHATSVTIGGVERVGTAGYTNPSSVRITFVTPPCVGADCTSPTGAPRAVTVVSAGGTATLQGGFRYSTCDAGFADCDGNAANGCEARTDMIPNCGGCGQTCDDSSACTNDVCVGGACRNVDRGACASPACELAPVLPVGCPDPDNDSDGLNDTWETNGYVDLDCNGQLDPGDTPLPGADPTIPNIYVRYDYMQASGAEPSHQPMPDVLENLIDAFAAQGIRLHFDPPPDALPHANVITLGPPPSCAGSDAVNFYDIKASRFDPRKKLTHRYAVFGHFVTCASPSACAACATEGIQATFGATGLAELLGNDSIMSLGGAVLPPINALDALARYQAGTILHEVGHNLGLRHGGDQDTVRKPNYISSMNYTYQLAGINRSAIPGSTTPAGQPRADLSPQVLPTLDEIHLDEGRGISAIPCGTLDIATYFCPGGIVRPAPGCGKVDWNCISPDTEPDVAADVNRDALFSRDLVGFDDWTFVKSHLRFQCEATFLDGAPPPGSLASNELDFETARSLNILFPIISARIDVRPNCDTNRVFLSGQSPVPVVLFGSPELDVTQIIVSSIRLAGAAPVGSLQSDVNGDGHRDLGLAFRTGDLSLTTASTSVTLTGQLSTSQAFAGTDSVVVVKGKEPRRPSSCP